MKAQSGFRVNFKCYQRSVESLEPTLLRVLTLSRNSRRQLSEYQNEFIALIQYELIRCANMNSTKLSEGKYDSFNLMLDASSDSFTKNLTRN